MFRKVLIANRGEIAVRILRTCRTLGVRTVALYHPADRGSLHVRLADECIPLEETSGFADQETILTLALEKGADAIHPGYGFLAEREDFIRSCHQAGLAFIGPPAEVVEATRHKLHALTKAEAAGFPTPPHSSLSFENGDMEAIAREAERLGYPVVVKSLRGGRGRGQRVAWSPQRLRQAVQKAQAEAQAIYGDRSIYLERLISPAHQIAVQIMGDKQGRLIHLGEREGSLLYGNQKILAEAPAPCLSPAKRRALWQAALEAARLFELQNVATVEFLLDEKGDFYFTEIKPRIQIEHPLTEMLSGQDLVAWQIRLAAGGLLDLSQRAIPLKGWAMQCRLTAEDPWRQFLPQAGVLRRARLPSGPGVRVDTYVYCGCYVPAEYDPLLAKIIAWGSDRQQCLNRLAQALRECQLSGVPTNLPLVQRILEEESFRQGSYNTEFLPDPFQEERRFEPHVYRDLAAIAAVMYLRERQLFRPAHPERLASNWHRASRALPH